MMRKEIVFFIALVLAAAALLCQGHVSHGGITHVKRLHKDVDEVNAHFVVKRQDQTNDADNTDSTTTGSTMPTDADKKDTSTGGMKSTDDKKKDNTTTAAPASDDKKDTTNTAAPASADKKGTTTNTTATGSQDANKKDTTTAAAPASDDKKDNTTAAAPASDDKKDNTTGSTMGTATGSQDANNKNTTTPASGTAAGQSATNASATGVNATSDPDAPTIDFLLSNYWNSTYFLAQSKPNIKFVKNGNYSDTTQNSTSTQPVIVGISAMERRQYQIMEGLGAGLTDASAIVLSALKDSRPDAYNEIMNLCFNESPDWLAKGGAGMNMIRTPIGASDFGFVEYTYDDTYDGSNDTALEHFDISKSKKRWATIRDILKINPKLRVMATPWSQPAWMKGTNGTLHGGSVLQQFEDAFAAYMVKFVSELEKKEGIKVDTISLQNEPQYDGANYPCTRMPAYQQARIGPLVRGKLDNASYQGIGILAYDHNWDNTSYPIEVFDQAAENFKGVAWHCYSDDPDGQDPFNRAYPNKTVWFTECTKISQNFMEPWQNIKDQFSKLIVTNSTIDYASSAVILWNLALQIDDDGFTTPTLPGVCKNCLAPILVFNNATNGTLQGADQSKLDSAKGSTSDMGPGTAHDANSPPTRSKRDTTPAVAGMTPQETSQSMVAGQGGKNSTNPTGTLNKGATNQNEVIPPVRPDYYRSSDFVVLAHLGQAIRPRGNRRWAQRVGVITSEDSALNPRVKAQLFRNDLGNGSSRWSLIVLQYNDHFGFNFAKFEDVTFQIKFRDYVAQITLPPGAFTMQWTAKDSIYETNPGARENTLGASRNTVRH